TPSSSIIASADSSCLDVASSTERPDNSQDPPVRQLCSILSASDTLGRASEIVRCFGPAPRYWRNAMMSGGDILVGSDKLTEGRREGCVLGDSEGIDTEYVFRP